MHTTVIEAEAGSAVVTIVEPDRFLENTSAVKTEFGSEAEWTAWGLEFARGRDTDNWTWGDWVAFGDHAYGNLRKLFNSREWKAAGGDSYQTMMNRASVSRAYESSGHRENLSWSLHAVAASSPNREKLLDWCEETGATVEQLKAKIAGPKKEKLKLPIIKAVSKLESAAEVFHDISLGKTKTTEDELRYAAKEAKRYSEMFLGLHAEIEDRLKRVNRQKVSV
jgi:hypothetical protein